MEILEKWIVLGLSENPRLRLSPVAITGWPFASELSL